MVQAKEYLGKHYTCTEKTGKTSQELKLIKLGEAFNDFDLKTDGDEEDSLGRVKIDRITAQRIVGGALLISDAHSRNSWLDIIINKGFLSLNPTSEFIQIKDGPRTRYCNTNYRWEYDQKYKTVHKPNSGSKYFINRKLIEAFIVKLNGKSPHIPTLDKYSDTKSGSTLSGSQTMQNTETNLSDKEENQKVLDNLQKRIN